MKKKTKVSILLSLCMILSLSCNVFAAETGKELAGESCEATYETASNPIGVLTQDEIAELQKNSDVCDSCPVPYHFSLTPHSHEITKITSRYRGEIDRGVVAEVTKRVNTSSVLTYEKSRSVSNSYDVSIGFDKGVVDAQMGYNVSYSTTATASYSVDVPANKLASINLYDMYDVTKFDAKTTYVYDTIPITYSYEYGTGWAQQWTNFGFSAKIW